MSLIYQPGAIFIKKRVIYQNGDGVSILIPTGELPVEVVARKDVPQGVPYKIVEDTEVPDDRTFRAAWEAEEFTPEGFGDPEGYWAEKEAERLAEESARPVRGGRPVAEEGVTE